MVIVINIVNTSNRSAPRINVVGPSSVMSSHKKKHRIIDARPAAAVNSA